MRVTFTTRVVDDRKPRHWINGIPVPRWLFVVVQRIT